MKLPFKFTARVAAIIAFICLAIWALLAEKANAQEYSTYLTLGSTVANSSSMIGGAGMRFGNFDLGVQLQEATTFKNGTTTEPLYLYHFTRIIRPTERFRVQGGISHVKDHPDIGEWNFRLGIGYEIFDVAEIWYLHDSSASIFNPNTGSDHINLTVRF